MERPYEVTVGRKQNGDHEHWARVWSRITDIVPRWWIDRLIDEAADWTARMARQHPPCGYGWSGGKDSIALKVVMDAAGITDCYIAVSRLEYPAFLAWVTEWMPDGLVVMDRAKVNMDWIVRCPELVFPRTANLANRWFSAIQGTGRRAYYREHGRGCVMIGHRTADGNPGERFYSDKDGRRTGSPLREWTHEDTMAACAYYGPPLPPTYSWPRGWSVGTGSWPARQWCSSEVSGWAEVWTIDPDMVRQAAPRFPLAARHVRLCAA